jgi:hypothetical protein
MVTDISQDCIASTIRDKQSTERNLLTLKMEALHSAEISITTSPHNVTSQKASIFRNTAVRTQTINPICS